jgi:hypothetical protein
MAVGLSARLLRALQPVPLLVRYHLDVGVSKFDIFANQATEIRNLKEPIQFSRKTIMRQEKLWLSRHRSGPNACNHALA